MPQFPSSGIAPELLIPTSVQNLENRKISQTPESFMAGSDGKVVVLDGGVYPDVDSRNFVDIKKNPNPHTGDLLQTTAGRSAVRDFHIRSLLAGARAITTNTWNVSTHIQGERAEAMTVNAVSLAFEAIELTGLTEDDITVFVSMRSIGDCYTMDGLPLDTKEGNAEIKQVMQANIRARKKALGDKRGILLFETATEIRELEIARDIAEKEDVEFGATACPSDDGKTLRSGESTAKLVDIMEGAAVLGFNCNEGDLIRKMLGRCIAVRKVLSAMRPSLHHPPLMVYAQGYMPPSKNRDPNNKHVSKKTAEEVRADNIREIVNCLELGATIVGGCCGVTIEEIGHNAQIVREWEESKKQAVTFLPF